MRFEIRYFFLWIGLSPKGLTKSQEKSIKFQTSLLYKFGSLQLKMLIDHGVGFKDSKGRNKVILTILLEIMYSV